MFADYNKIVQDNFKRSGTNLFRVDLDPNFLIEVYLSGFDTPELRQEHNCNCCKSFLRRTGGLVVVDGDQYKSALWADADLGQSEKLYGASHRALREAVETAAKTRQVSPYIPSDRVLGTAQAGGWDHFSVTYAGDVSRAEARMGDARQDIVSAKTARAAFKVDTVRKALALLQSGQLYRGDRYVAMVTWFLSLYDIRSDVRLNGAIRSAGAGFARISGTVVGKLLENLEAGKSFDSINREWSSMLSVDTYQRAQVAPDAGNIARAEQLIGELGLAGAMRRRLATMADVPAGAFLWRSREARKPAASGGVFSHIAPKTVAKTTSPVVDAPATTMTWSKFKSKVLPLASNIEVYNPGSINRFVSLTAPADETAKPILQWDDETSRNGVSWSYVTSGGAGADAEMRRRVVSAGGRYDDNDIRCSLRWGTTCDLDLFCITPNGGRIYFGAKVGQSGGNLDIDQNAYSNLTTTPVENIRWSRGTAPNGRYQFGVHMYTRRNRGVIPYYVELQVGDRLFNFEGQIRGGSEERHTVFTLDYLNGVAQVNGGAEQVRATAPTGWVKVKGIVPSPNLWGDRKVESAGNHTFLLLDDVDLSKATIQGLFVEHLRGELREIRSTMEAYLRTADVAGSSDTNVAKGVGFTDQTPWNLTLRVETDLGVQTYLIDRAD